MLGPLPKVETRELLRDMPLEDGALAELMPGMDADDVMMVLHFGEG